MPREPRRKPNKEFKDEKHMLEFSMKTLADGGISPSFIEEMRGRTDTSIFTKEFIGQRRYATSMLLAAGLSNDQIAKVFQQSKETVANDREHIRRVYTDNILQNADHWRAKLLKEQDEIKQKALESFEKSKKKVIKKVQDRQGQESVSTEVHETAGESSFLTVAKGCLEQQARLLGLYDSKPQVEDDEKSYKKFLSNLSAQVKKIKEAERNAGDRASAIDAEAEFDEEGEPIGNSRPMLPANPEESIEDS